MLRPARHNTWLLAVIDGRCPRAWRSPLETHICVVEGSGALDARGREVTQPELLAVAIKRLAPAAKLAVLETGGQSS
jgi:hypothetical protein